MKLIISSFWRSTTTSKLLNDILLSLISVNIFFTVCSCAGPYYGAAVNGLDRPIVELVRKANSDLLRSIEIPVDGDTTSFALLSANKTCRYNPLFTIIISNAQSIHADNKYYDYGILSLQAVQMVVDYINYERCGVVVNGQNYAIELHTYADESDVNITQAIGHYMANKTHFILSGYSSNLTGALTPIAQENNKVIVSGGASSEKAFVNKSLAFGILPTSTRVLDQGIAGVAAMGAKTVAAIYEDGLHTCKPVPDVAALYGLEVLAMNVVPTKPNASALDDAAFNMSQINPDVVVTCTYDYACGEWVRAMRRVGWSPKAQIFSICIGMPDLEATAGLTDLAYMMGVASWNRMIQPTQPDGITGWTPEQFATNFEEVTYKNASYQHTAAASAVSALVQAIEISNSFESDIVAQTLANNTFYTMYGETYFDENGQNNAPSFLMQYDKFGILNVVRQTVDDTIIAADIVYPMPSWAQRDCMALSSCEESGGTCDNVDGTCNCNAVMDEDTTNSMISMGNGSNAFCKVVQEEDMNKISDVWIYTGITLVSIQGILSLGCAIWTLKNKSVNIVSASQPEFLYLIAFGCFVLSTAIIPLAMQGDHRYIKDEQTGQLTNIPNPEVNGLDAACMSAPWLSGIGFATVFSALFAKIWRVKKILQNAERFRRQKVEIKDVMFIMIVMLTFEIGVLLTWQLVSPLRWEREILREDDDEFPIESIGYCSSDHTLGFAITLAVFNCGSLLYALYLCWITRDVSSDFNEGRWITMSVASIFQILLLAVPILIIASEDRTASFFVRTAVIFLCTSTVTMLIFGPKVWRVKYEPERGNTQLNVRKSVFNKTSTQLGQMPSFGLSECSQADVPQLRLPEQRN